MIAISRRNRRRRYDPGALRVLAHHRPICREADEMRTGGRATVGAAALVAVGILVFLRQRSTRLRARFLSEYDRVVAESGGRRRAEQELRRREKRRDELELAQLTAAARDRYAEQWRWVQREFLGSPVTGIREASTLVEHVMSDCGYPVSDFEEQAALLSVDHADFVQGYRAAHGISQAAARGDTPTEDLRGAMRQYGSLFEQLLGEADVGKPLRGCR